MTILQKITLTTLIFSSGSSLCAAPELSQLAGALSEILVSLAGKTGAEILTTQETAISQAFADPAGIDTTSGSEIITAVEKAIVELEDALIRSGKIKFSDKSADQDTKTRTSILKFAKVDPNAIQDATLSKEIAAILKNIKPLYTTTTDSHKKLTSLGRTALKNLPDQLAHYKKITNEQTERRTQIKQNYAIALDSNKHKTIKDDAKKQLEKLASEYAPLEGIVNSLGNLITSIKGELTSFTKSTISSHIEDTLIKQLTEIAQRPVYAFTKEELANKIADKATAPGDRSLYTQMKANLEATDALLADVLQAIDATKNQLTDGKERMNTIYNFVVEMRKKITARDPNAQKYMDEQTFKFVPGKIKNIFSTKLKDIAGAKGAEGIFKGDSQPGDDSSTGPKKLTPAEIDAIKLLPERMLSFAGESIGALTESLEKDLEELIGRQEMVARAEGAKSRATFNTIKKIRAELKKLSGDARKQYVQQEGAQLSKELQEALAGESEWD